MVETIAKGLGEKLPQVAFVGGSIMELYTDGKGEAYARVTDDVDIVIEIATRANYDEFENELREKDFFNDKSGPSCRFIYNNVKVDVIGTEQSVAGFTNKWYGKGFDKKTEVNTGSYNINIFPVEYFLGSKFVAFEGRGKGNLITSHDIEDIIYVLDGRTNIINDLENADREIQLFLKERFSNLSKNGSIREIIQGHLGMENFKERVDRIINILNYNKL